MLKAPPPLWAIALLTAFYFLSDLPFFATLPSLQNTIVGLALTATGIALPVIAIAQFRAANTQVMPTSETNNQLIITGLYHLTRNPMYVGVILASCGVALWVGRPLMFLAPLCVFIITNWVLIPYEEAKMRRQFGAAYDAYTQRVRRWI
jgi:protein-S-isoprenylcysteine O-methyltransferase Ste14